MDLHVSPGIPQGVVLQLAGGELSAPVLAARGKSENSMRGGLSLASGGGVRSEAVIVSSVPRGRDSMVEAWGWRSALSRVPPESRRRQSRTGKAGVVLPYKRDDHVAGAVPPGTVRPGWLKLCP